jgi:hypothetical protein
VLNWRGPPILEWRSRETFLSLEVGIFEYPNSKLYATHLPDVALYLNLKTLNMGLVYCT